MTVEQLRNAWRAQPFQPFSLHLADVRSVPVLSPEFLLAFPSGRTIIVAQPDESYNVIDVLLVTELEFRSGPRTGKRCKA